MIKKAFLCFLFFKIPFLQANEKEIFGLPWLKEKKEKAPPTEWTSSEEFAPSFQLPWQDDSADDPNYVRQEDKNNIFLREEKSLTNHVIHRTYQDYQVVVLNVLDKLTSKSKSLSIKVGETRKFGWIYILPRIVKKTLPNQELEIVVYLDIVSKQPKKETKKIFSGYMFASTPSVSKLEHPYYDISVADALQPIQN